MADSRGGRAGVGERLLSADTPIWIAGLLLGVVLGFGVIALIGQLLG